MKYNDVEIKTFCAIGEILRKEKDIPHDIKNYKEFRSYFMKFADAHEDVRIKLKYPLAIDVYEFEKSTVQYLIITVSFDDETRSLVGKLGKRFSLIPYTDFSGLVKDRKHNLVARYAFTDGAKSTDE